VRRVVLDGVGDVSREALEAAIADSLRERLGTMTPRPPVREASLGAQVAGTVAPAVLERANLAGPGDPR
jgi:hypothetical protein